MSCKSVFGYCLPDTFTSSAWICSSDRLRYVDTVFFGDIGDCFDKSCFLISVEIEIIIVSDHRYTYRAIVVPVDMSSLDIVTSSSSLINLPSLSDHIVIPDISPPFCARMVGINSTQECLIICSFIERF